ncbi:MAG: 3-deoxy-7-phosphoheptulonate synthase [Rhodopseudomonas palustris]|nr:3-deoxy-7-phosphoheptulonate synthase [Rhodopseudomonas palustris]
MTTTDDLRLKQITELQYTRRGDARDSARATRTVAAARSAIHDILTGADDRLIVIVGPCSIHDPAAAMDYASRLAALREALADRLVIVMRVYFEKPRTTVGWKGLINDPDLDEQLPHRRGPAPRAPAAAGHQPSSACRPATEFLDVITPQYIGDLIAWGAIGARTTESQVHRELASGLSCPVGFKNGTDGNIRIAADADPSGRAAAPLPVGHQGRPRRDRRRPRATRTATSSCAAARRRTTTPPASTPPAAELGKRRRRAARDDRLPATPTAARSTENQLGGGGRRRARRWRPVTTASFGVMIESHIAAGRQDVVPNKPLTYGQSITDGCIDWATTESVLRELAAAVEAKACCPATRAPAARRCRGLEARRSCVTTSVMAGLVPAIDVFELGQRVRRGYPRQARA